MRIYAKALFVCGSLLCVSTAFAEPTGKYESVLLQILMANANGECPSSLMADPLKQSCDSQIADMRDKLAKLGKITKVTYGGPQGTTADNKGERYTVYFEHGEWYWTLKGQSDGRLIFAQAPNPPWYDVGSYSRSKN